MTDIRPGLISSGIRARRDARSCQYATVGLRIGCALAVEEQHARLLRHTEQFACRSAPFFGHGEEACQAGGAGLS